MDIELNQKQRLHGYLEKLKGASILVVGDIMLDRFVYGDVERISPESPVPVLAVERKDVMLGGAGNALANLAGLGVKGALLALVGADDEGAQVQEFAENLGFDASGLLIDEVRPTVVKTRFLAGHQQLLRVDEEKKLPLSDEMAQALIARAESLMRGVDAVILSDYGKGVLRPDVISSIIKFAKANNIPVIVDPKGTDFTIYKGATAITPNRKELSEATAGHATKTDEEVIAAAQKILDECEIENVVATRSADGISVIAQNQPPVHVRAAQDIEVFDVSGAGDTVIATIAAVRAAGGSFEEAAQLANVAGSIVVAKVGTAPIRMEELSAALLAEGGNRGLCTLEQAVEHVKRWKARGLKVGFTNGCFDILHAGHVTYLQEAAGLCDRLIVGLNRDASISILKGPERPIHEEQSRATVLNGLDAVDMVVLFGAEKQGDDNTACALLEALQPDLYFKGGDYQVDEIPETPTVRQYGGDVQVLSELKGHSTTAAITKIRA